MRRRRKWWSDSGRDSRHGLRAGACGANNDLAELLHLGLVARVGKHIEDLGAGLGLHVAVVMEPLATDAARQVDVLLHDSDTRSMNRAEVGILEEPCEIALSSLLEGKKSLGLEPQLTVDTVADASNESLEGGLSQE